MRLCTIISLAVLSLAIAGCDGAKVEVLTAQVKKLEAEIQDLKAKNAKAEADLVAYKTQIDQVAAIKQGYETARVQLQEKLGALAPLLGNTGSPLPTFEELRDPSWIGKLVPNQQTAAGLGELQNLMQGLTGSQAAAGAPGQAAAGAPGQAPAGAPGQVPAGAPGPTGTPVQMGVPAPGGSPNQAGAPPQSVAPAPAAAPGLSLAPAPTVAPAPAAPAPGVTGS
jgi:outer membrane murein-binding lipoprotein Lpp